MRAAIYTRISRDKTGEQAGVTRQREDCRKLADSLGWTVVDEFEDNDISATSGKVRPEFERLLRAVKAQEVDAIVCWHPDRLYRKLRDLERLIEVVEGNHVAVKPVMAGEVDLSSASGRGIARILGVIASMEGEQKSERWRRSIRQRRENGQAPGWGPRLFGYARDGTLIAHEADAARWGASQLIDGASLNTVAAGLTQRAPTTAGNPWTIASVKAYYRNPRIAGHSTLNKVTVGIGQWDPILTDETFEQVKAALGVRRGTGPGPRVAVLAGLIHCAECGTVMVSARGNKPRNGDGRRQRIYRCKKQAGQKGCGAYSINAEPLEEMVESAVRTWINDPIIRAELERQSASSGQHTAEIIDLEERIRELEKEYAAPGTPAAAISLAIERCQERINELHATVTAPVRLPKGEWPDDLARRHKLVRLVVAGIIVGPRTPGRSTKVFQPERIRIVQR